jgi:hypothetical protein
MSQCCVTSQRARHWPAQLSADRATFNWEDSDFRDTIHVNNFLHIANSAQPVTVTLERSILVTGQHATHFQRT